MARKRNDLASIYKTTVRDQEDYQQLRPIHENYRQAQNEIKKRDQTIQEQDIEIKKLKELVEKLEREHNEDDVAS